MFTAFIPDGDVGKFAGDLPRLLVKDFSGTMKILRDRDFQDLVLNYPRAQRSFIIAPGVTDDVNSEWLVMGQKPEDYLNAFAKFVRENPEHIEAISILLKRPKQWRTDTLNELRQKLQRNKFPERELQRAHERVYHKTLADIISMVKHAAQEGEPVLSAEERVDRAIARVTKGKTLTQEQEKWLRLIRDHLVSNLTLDVADFGNFPIFTDRGGRKKAEDAFGGNLAGIVAEINYAVAA